VDIRKPQPAHVADAAAGPVAEGEQGGAALAAVALDELAQDVALVRVELARRQQRLGRELEAAGRVVAQQALLLDQPAGEAADDRADAGAVADTDITSLRLGEVDLQGGAGELVGGEGPAAAGALGQPGGELAEDAGVGVHGAGRLAGQRRQVGVGEWG
jgi:hypothetical protein